MKRTKLRKHLLLAFITLAVCSSSCRTAKSIAYFRDLPDSARAAILNAKYHQLTIQPDDILSISVETIDPTANAVFNQGQQGTGATGSGTGSAYGAVLPSAFSGYLVDKNGIVELPLLGQFKLAGLTTMEARDTIEKTASVYYKKPAVYVRFANLKVTILGEVSHPGTYVLPNEKNTIFDALGLSGDLTIFGKRDNVLLIRDSSGYSSLTRFSLTSKDLVKQDFFFLKQNDVIYVEPNQSKVYSQDAIRTRNYTIIVSVVTLLIVIFSRVNF